MEIDRNGLEVLDRDECLHLLASMSLGRIGVQSGALPTVLPVNFALSDEQIVIRTGTGTKLEAATRNAVVAFEVDDIDRMYHTGWSVTVTGVAREVTDPVERAKMDLLPLANWSPGPTDRYVAISTELVDGRRINRNANELFGVRVTPSFWHPTHAGSRP